MEVNASGLLIKGVLDQYYSWLVELMRPKGADRVALLSTIVTHDVIKDAPLYTASVFRGFADRTLSISPEDFGPGNVTDRYSRRYADLIAVVAYELYANASYTPGQKHDLDGCTGDITEAIIEINRIRQEANEKWIAFALNSV